MQPVRIHKDKDKLADDLKTILGMDGFDDLLTKCIKGLEHSIKLMIRSMKLHHELSSTNKLEMTITSEADATTINLMLEYVLDGGYVYPNGTSWELHGYFTLKQYAVTVQRHSKTTTINIAKIDLIGDFTKGWQALHTEEIKGHVQQLENLCLDAGKSSSDVKEVATPYPLGSLIFRFAFESFALKYSPKSADIITTNLYTGSRHTIKFEAGKFVDCYLQIKLAQQAGVNAS